MYCKLEVASHFLHHVTDLNFFAYQSCLLISHYRGLLFSIFPALLTSLLCILHPSLNLGFFGNLLTDFDFFFGINELHSDKVDCIRLVKWEIFSSTVLCWMLASVFLNFVLDRSRACSTSFTDSGDQWYPGWREDCWFLLVDQIQVFQHLL